MLQEKYINPFTDFGFKKLFGEEPNKDLLINFLNQFLPEVHQIKELSYAKNERLTESVFERRSIFDVYCIGENGERFVVEVQKAKQNFFKDRSVYYSTFPIQEQALKGDWDYKLAPVYMVGILDFVFPEDRDNPDVIHKVQLKNRKNQVFYDKLMYIYLTMPNFKKTETELETMQDKWLYVFRHLPDLEKKPKKFQEKVFSKLFNVAALAKLNREERDKYEAGLKSYRDAYAIRKTGEDEARTQGFDKGVEQGIEQGIEQGKLAIARNLKMLSFPIAGIAQATGLTVEEINKL